jgi:Ca2+-binding EF-hand superfamily protein
VLSFDEFLQGIQAYIKGSEEDKVKSLFALYDLHEQGGIGKEDFL